MGTESPPNEESPEVACTVPAAYEPDAATESILAGAPDEDGGDA